MTPATIALLVNASLTILNELLPEFQKLHAAGLITAEDQQKVLDAINELRAKTPTGPEWEIK